VNYRETITAPAKFDYTHKKQSGGSGQYGKITGCIEPIPAAESGESPRLEFHNLLVGNDIPGVFVSSIEAGFSEAMASGSLTGHPVQVRCCCVSSDFTLHCLSLTLLPTNAVATCSMSFQTARTMCFVFTCCMRCTPTGFNSW
jgi:translation elongation factor EF-G